MQFSVRMRTEFHNFIINCKFYEEANLIDTKLHVFLVLYLPSYRKKEMEELLRAHSNLIHTFSNGITK